MEQAQYAQAMLGQLASLSTYLGGFSLVFLGAIISISQREDRATQTTVVMSALSSVCFILCAVGWGLLQLNATIIPVNLSPTELNEYIANLFSTHHKYFSLSFIVGLLGFLICVGTSGYIYDKKTGRITAVFGSMGFIALGFILSPYVQVG